jgi:hypothetical protein
LAKSNCTITMDLHLFTFSKMRNVSRAGGTNLG